MNLLAEVIPGRNLTTLNIYLDIIYLIILGFLLIRNKKYLTFIYGLFGGILYFIVDYGYFHLFLNVRVIDSTSSVWGNYAIFLFWLSMSYGFTNFVMIWLWFNKEKKLPYWITYIIAGWLITGFAGKLLGGSFDTVEISRKTAAYHNGMIIILVVTYGYLIIRNLKSKDSKKKVNIFWLLAIGILVQFGWEFSLLVTGIRQSPNGLWTLIENSLIETNMGIPLMYLIYCKVTKRFKEDLNPVLTNDTLVEEELVSI